MSIATVASFATADLMDAHEGLQSCETPFESFGKRRIFAGRIRTVRCRHDNALVKRLLSEQAPGAVLVIDGGVVWRPGEYLYSDRDGIVVSPTAL